MRHLPKVLSSLEPTALRETPLPVDTTQVLIYREKITDFHVKMVEATENKWLVEYYRASTSVWPDINTLSFNNLEQGSVLSTIIKPF